jgi:hypothetical protein
MAVSLARSNRAALSMFAHDLLGKPASTFPDHAQGRSAAANTTSWSILAASSSTAEARFRMSHVIYKVVQHDGGWAYTVNGVFSEPFPTHAAALAAARRAANEQRVPGRTEAIQYETPDGKWLTETASGNDRPETEVEDGR